MAPIGINLPEAFGPLQQGLSFDIPDGYTVFIGRNNSGKTSLLEYIFKYLCDTPDFGTDQICIILPGRIFIDATLQPGDRTLRNYNERMRHHIAGQALGHFDYVNDPPMRELPRVLLHHTNLFEQVDKINTSLTKLMLPKLVITGPQELHFEDVKVGNQGSGLRSVFPILAALSDEKTKVLLIDEPEISLEPVLQKLLHEQLLSAAGNKRIIVTTHSHLFLNRVNVENNYTLIRKENGVVIKSIDNMAELYDVAYKLLGNSLEDLFFPANFIFVEGYSDEAIVKKVIELKGIPKEKIQVLSGNGDALQIDKTRQALVKTITPVVATDSPYKSRVVCIADKRNKQNTPATVELENELKDRFFELGKQSIEEYIPGEVYERVGRNKEQDLAQLKNAKANYSELKKIKEEVSLAISESLKVDDLPSIEKIVAAVNIANELAT